MNVQMTPEGALRISGPQPPLSGEVRVPGDKSISHRALILGATPADAAAHALATLPPQSDGARPPSVSGARHPGTEPRAGGATGSGEERFPDIDGDAQVRVRSGGAALRLPGAGWRARGLGRAALALDADTIRGVLTDAIAASCCSI